MSIHNIAQLELDPKHNPRDKRVWERIQNELEPLAEDIWQEYRRGLTEEEVLERARKRKKRREMREESREAAASQKGEEAASARAENRVDDELFERVAELTQEGPIKYSEVRGLLRNEGWTWNEIAKLRDTNAFDIGQDGGRTWIRRAS